MTAIRGIKIEDYKAWLDNPLTKALKQSHAHQIEQRDALLRQAVDALDELMHSNSTKTAQHKYLAVTDAIRLHLEGKQ